MTPISPKHLIIVLLLAGLTILVIRVLNTSDEAIPSGDTMWQLSMSMAYKSAKNSPNIHLAIPQDSANIRVVSQAFDHPGFSLKRIMQKKKNQREIIATPLVEGEITFLAEYNLHVSESGRWQQWLETTGKLSPESRQRYLTQPAESSHEESDISKTLKILRSGLSNQDQLLDEIYNYVHKNILSDPDTIFESEEKTLETGRANALAKAKLMVALCRASNIPARIVTGIELREMIDLYEHYWVEVNLNDKWVPYDPNLGYRAGIPNNYFKINVDSDLLAYLDDGTPLDVTIDSIQLPVPSGLLGSGDKRMVDIFDLRRLSVNTQFLLATILLLPIGAFITSLFRQLIGVATYGTFTPALLAMATMHAEWFTVIVVVLIVIAVGFASRSIMPEKMTRVPRLSIILTIVAVGMVFSISIMDYYKLNPNPAVILLPIIVLTNLVDRFYKTTDEGGIIAAFYRLMWTFIVTVVCFSIFIIEPLQQLVLSYPEIHFFTMILILMLSSYKGKKLCSLPYCRWLSEPIKATK